VDYGGLSGGVVVFCLRLLWLGLRPIVAVPLPLGLAGLRVVLQPNKSVKVTRRPLAALKVGFLSGFGASLRLSEVARALP
jgi:hypothetical protein